jgi:hypothetical protein
MPLENATHVLIAIEKYNMSFMPLFLIEVFYGTQYDLYAPLKKDSYAIEKDLYVRI